MELLDDFGMMIGTGYDLPLRFWCLRWMGWDGEWDLFLGHGLCHFEIVWDECDSE